MRKHRVRKVILLTAIVIIAIPIAWLMYENHRVHRIRARLLASVKWVNMREKELESGDLSTLLQLGHIAVDPGAAEWKRDQAQELLRRHVVTHNGNDLSEFSARDLPLLRAARFDSAKKKFILPKPTTLTGSE